MLVWRIEHSTTGLGPFSGGHYAGEHMNDHEIPQAMGMFLTAEARRAAMDLLSDGGIFGATGMKELDVFVERWRGIVELGYHVVVIETDEYFVCTDNQVIFRRGTEIKRLASFAEIADELDAAYS